MAAPSVTWTFTNSTTADATQVNTNFTDLINGASDGTKDYTINALTCNGATVLKGAVNLGDGTPDDISVLGSIATSIPVKTTFSYDLGTSSIGWKSIYFGSNDSAARTTRIIAGAVSASWTFTLPTAVGAIGKMLTTTDASGATTWRFADKVLASQTSSPVTATGDETVIPVDATSGAITVNLPAAATIGSGKRYIIKKIDSSTNAVTIDGNSTELIDGAQNTTLNTQYESLEIICDGTGWHIIQRHIPSTVVDMGASTLTGVTSNPTKGTTNVDKVWMRRAGDKAEFTFQYSQTAGGAAGTGGYRLTLPSSLTIDTAKVSTGGGSYSKQVGTFVGSDGTAVIVGPVLITDADKVGVTGLNDTLTNAEWGSGRLALSNTTVLVTMNFSVPITGWNG